MDRSPEICEGCGGEDSVLPMHTCPYKEELGGGCDECNCCDRCANECAMDI